MRRALDLTLDAPDKPGHDERRFSDEDENLERS
jgi:hypothetical protein